MGSEKDTRWGINGININIEMNQTGWKEKNQLDQYKKSKVIKSNQYWEERFTVIFLKTKLKRRLEPAVELALNLEQLS